jgi:hypothetical protein
MQACMDRCCERCDRQYVSSCEGEMAAGCAGSCYLSLAEPTIESGSRLDDYDTLLQEVDSGDNWQLYKREERTSELNSTSPLE